MGGGNTLTKQVTRSIQWYKHRTCCKKLFSNIHTYEHYQLLKLSIIMTVIYADDNTSKEKTVK